MWKREEAAKPVAPAQADGTTSSERAATPPTARSGDQGVVTIGKSIIIKGELSGSEDLTIEGHVEGKVELKQHVLTIGSHGRIRAQIFAKSVVVLGEVLGNIKASEKVAIRDNGTVEGDIVAPRVAIAEGARFRGGIDMQQGQGARLKGDQKEPLPEARKGQNSKGKAPQTRSAVSMAQSGAGRE